MKKYICYSLLLLLAATAFQACKYDSLMVFDQKPDAFFSWLDGAYRELDSTKVRFFYISASESEVSVNIPVKITGALSDVDRYVSFTVVNDKSTAVAGQHYELLSEAITIPANKTEGFLQVRVIRAPDLSVPAPKTVRLSLRLEANESFGTNYQSKLNAGVSRQVLEYCIEISDGIVQPKWWEVPNAPAAYKTAFFGSYSAKKYLLICEINTCPPAYLDGIAYTNESGITMQITTNNHMSLLPVLAKRTQVYLNQQKALGNTIYEEDGVTEMVMGIMGKP